MDIGKLVVFLFVAGIIIGGAIVYFRNNPLTKPEFKDKKGDAPVIIAGAGMSIKEAQLLSKTQAEISAKNNPKPKPADEEKPRMIKCHECGEKVEVNDEKICPLCGASIEKEVEELVKAEQALKVMMMSMDMKRAQREDDEQRKKNAAAKAASVAANLVVPGTGRLVSNAINKKK